MRKGRNATEFHAHDVRAYVTAVETTPGLGPHVVAAILKDHGDGARDFNNLHPRHYRGVVRALFDVLSDFEHQKKLREENPWQLSVDHPRFVEATDALNSAWRRARELGSRHAALEYMHKWLGKYEDVAATNSGARSELYAKLDKRFPG